MAVCTNVHNKLEFLSLWFRLQPTRVKQPSALPLSGKLLALLTDSRLVNYYLKKFYDTTTRAQCYKTFCICNLQMIIIS